MVKTGDKKTLTVALLIGLGLAAGALSQHRTAAEALIVLTGFAIFGASGLWLQKEIGIFKLNRLTIPGWLYLSYMLMIFFPALGIFSTQTGIYRYYYIGSVQLTAIAFSFGIMATNRLLSSSAAETEAFYKRDLSIKEPPGLRTGFMILLAASLALTVVYLLEVKAAPLLYLLKGGRSIESLMIMREHSFKLLNSRLIYLFSWLRGTIYPLLILIAGGSYYVFKDKWWLIRFIATILPGLFYIALSTEKAPVAAVFVMMLFLLYLIRKGRVPLAWTGALVALAMIFPLAVIKVVAPGATVDLFQYVFNRVFSVPAFTLYYYFEIFPAKVGFLWGASIGKLAPLFGLRQFELTNYVFKYMYNGIESGSANAAFIGDLWANFGVIGVVAGSFLVAALFQAIHIMLIRKEKNILTLAVYAWFIYLTWMLASTSIFVVILSHGLIVALLIHAALNRTGKRDLDVALETGERIATDG